MLKPIALVVLALVLEGGFILHSVVSYAPPVARRAPAAAMSEARPAPAAAAGAASELSGAVAARR